MQPPGEAKYAHCLGILPGLPTVALAWGAGGVVEEEAGVDPVDGVDLGTDSVTFP